VTACKSDARHPPSVAATASVADAATRAVDGPLPDPKAVDAAAVDAATVDAPSGPVTLGLCPAITAVLAAQDSWFQTLRGTGTGERGLPGPRCRQGALEASRSTNARRGGWPLPKRPLREVALLTIAIVTACKAERDRRLAPGRGQPDQPQLAAIR
jgi:hypothetical protein